MKEKKEIFYISNLLSLSRLILLGITVFFLLSPLKNRYLYSIIMIFFIWISDLLDGYFARKRNEVSEFGKIIDPLADKVCVITIALIIAVNGLIPLWFVLLIVLRDVIIFSGGIYLKSKNKIILQSNWVGKISVFIIGLTLLFSIFYSHIKYTDFQIFFSYHAENLELYLKILIILSIIMSIVSLFVYFKRFFNIVFKGNK